MTPNRAIGFIVPAILVVLWELSAHASWAPSYLVAPSQIAAQFVALIADGELGTHLAATLFRALAGFAVGSIFGILIGMLAGTSPRIGSFVDPLISVIYPLPKVALLPIIVVWLGIGDASKIATVAFSVFFPAFINAYAGVKSINPLLFWAAHNMGASRRRIFFRVTLPAAMPQILTGLRVGLGLSFVIVFAAELFGARTGLGYLIAIAQQSNRFDLMYVAILTIGLAGFVSDRLLLLARRRLLAGQSIRTEEFRV